MTLSRPIPADITLAARFNFSVLSAPTHRHSIAMKNATTLGNLASLMKTGLRGAIFVSTILWLPLQLAAQTTVALSGGDPGQGLTLDPAKVLFAYSLNATSSTTVQGVTFVPLALGSLFPTRLDPFAAGQASANDNALRGLLQRVTWDEGGDSPIHTTFSGLVPNGQYQLDVLQWSGAYASREQAIVVNGSLVAITTVTIGTGTAQNTYFNTYANAAGQIEFLMQESGFYGGTGNQDGAIVNALVLSNVSAVPEPSTYAAIFGVVVLGFAAYKRRRTA